MAPSLSTYFLDIFLKKHNLIEERSSRKNCRVNLKDLPYVWPVIGTKELALPYLIVIFLVYFQYFPRWLR